MNSAQQEAYFVKSNATLKRVLILGRAVVCDGDGGRSSITLEPVQTAAAGPITCLLCVSM
jgi:hypothetical protein